MFKIAALEAREIPDSRGNPTVEAACRLESGIEGRASVPSGRSTGSREALELRDGDPERCAGLGVLKAVENINKEIASRIVGRSFEQDDLDRTLIKLDGTAHKSRLGANAILAVSLAFARASAAGKKVELFRHLGELSGNKEFKLPEPFFNIINGGKHSQSGLELQEFLINPSGFKTFREKVRAANAVIEALKALLIGRGDCRDLGDEGGFAPNLLDNEEAIGLVEEAVKMAGYTFDQIKLGLDAAATSFYKNGFYTLRIDGEEKKLTREGLMMWYEKLVRDHHIASIEDGFGEDDWGGFSHMMAHLGGKILVVGDDLLTTDAKLIEQAARSKAVNAVLIKPNQIGTLTETIEAIKTAKKNGIKPFVSHRSGETLDAFIADLAVGCGCPFIKAGAPTKPERMAKYDRLIEIENLLRQN